MHDLFIQNSTFWGESRRKLGQEIQEFWRKNSLDSFGGWFSFIVVFSGSLLQFLMKKRTIFTPKKSRITFENLNILRYLQISDRPFIFWNKRIPVVPLSTCQYAHRFFHLGVHVPFYLHFWGYIQIFGGAMYPLTLHLGVQRKWTAFSPHKVVHDAVFCK